MGWLKRSWNSKTVWAALLGALGLVGAWATGEVTVVEMGVGVAGFMSVMFARDTIAKKG